MKPLQAMADAIRTAQGYAYIGKFESRAAEEDYHARVLALAALRALRENVSEEMVEAGQTWRTQSQGGDMHGILIAALRAAEEPTP